MPLTRREFLSLTGLAAASALIASCSPAPTVRALVVGKPTIGDWPSHDDHTWRALNRLTFGPRADERAHAAQIGIEAWIEEQLAPDTIDDTDALWRVRGLNTLTMDNSLIFSVREETVRRELAQAALLRAIYSKRQLTEVMVDFWSDHFSLSTHKADCAWLKPMDDRTVIRPHALGNFRDLLWATMQSPAMLKYLDQQENHKRKPNENYARELMELHTLGVDGGYTQHDVQEVARCLTGWTVDAHLRRGQFTFDAAQHDDGGKTVLGQLIAANGGARDAEQVCDRLMAHPSTARFIARKLVRRFVADDPPAALVASAAETFARTRGDIKSVLRAILYSPEFASAAPKFKRPLHDIAGALRQLNAESDGGQALLDALAAMGQPLFQWPTPDGFPDVTSAWSGNMLARWQFALRLATGAISGTTLDLKALAQAARVTTIADALDQFSRLLLGAPLPRAGVDALLHRMGHALDEDGLKVAVAVLLASPQYQWR